MLNPINWSLALPYYAAALAFGYLCGSIPFGMIVTRLAGTGDIRALGSGNIGATNVLRTGRKSLAIATLLGDLLKGTLAVLLVYRLYGQDLAVLAGLGAVLGHVFPVWLRFKGGKGVATYLGVLIALSWPVALAFCAIFVVIAAIFRYASLASLISCVATPVILWWLGDRQEAMLFAILAVVVVVMHHANIRRLIAGAEGKIGQKG
jgi:glycerol-3-phosphate acyltransferase PlsY